MMKDFEKTTFLVRKYLLSMKPDEQRLISASKCKYSSLKSTCSQLKHEQAGEWRVTKKNGLGDSFTRVTRIK